MTHLSEKALLLYVSISAWTGRRLDRKATDAAQKAYAAETQTGNYTKKLLPGARELERISHITGVIRKYFHAETLPWLSDGGRIISSRNLLPFTTEFRRLKGEFDQAVSDFAVAYPALVQNAQRSLGNLYNPADYPDVNQLIRRFQCELNILPLPDVRDFRVEVTEAERAQFTAKMKAIEAEAMQECWKRLHEVIQKAAERLAEPGAVFRDSLIDNITEMTQLLPRLNVTDDPSLEAARVRVESFVAKLTPDVLRDNATERKNAADQLAEIQRSMGAFMGSAT